MTTTGGLSLVRATPDESAIANVDISEARAIRRILLCLDRSTLSEACLPHAVFLANTFGSTITLLLVMQPAHERSSIPPTDALGWEISRQEAIAYLERFEKEYLGHEVDVRLEQGRPAERIAAVEREIGADLIVLGGHGESGVAPWNLGSTAQHVLTLAQGSVFVARGGAGPHVAFSPENILVPLDGSLRAESVLPIAARIAKANGASILLAHVVQDALPTGVLRAPDDLALADELAVRLEAGARRYLDQMQSRLGDGIASIRTMVLRQSDHCNALLELSDRAHVDLVVLSAHGATCNRQRSFGGVTTHLLAHSPIPLLVLQDLSESGQHRPEISSDRPPSLRSHSPKEMI
ncbi:MAG: universal stress protein [Myxococcota bacterium]|nr:universal stress protein [Myxococcota bacterium]